MPGLRPPRPRTSWGRAYEGALEAVFSVVLTMLGGYYADRYFETEPVFLFIGLVLGGAAAVRRLLAIGPGAPAASDTPERSDAPVDGRGSSPESDRHADADSGVDVAEGTVRPAVRGQGSAPTGEAPGDDGKRNG